MVKGYGKKGSFFVFFGYGKEGRLLLLTSKGSFFLVRVRGKGILLFLTSKKKKIARYLMKKSLYKLKGDLY